MICRSLTISIANGRPTRRNIFGTFLFASRNVVLAVQSYPLRDRRHNHSHLLLPMAFYEEPDPYGDEEPVYAQEAQVKSSWSPMSGGCLNLATWRQNPQFLLSIGNEHTSPTKCHIEAKLTRQDIKSRTSIGIYIVPLPLNASLPLTSLEEAISQNSLAKIGFSVNAVALGEIELNRGQYVLIPCTFDVLQSDDSLSFDLAVRSNTSSVTLQEIPILENTIRCTGTWVSPSEVVNAQKARFSFSSDDVGFVRLWLVPSNRSVNPTPMLHLWKFKILEPLELIRQYGETYAEFEIQSNTPYFLTASSSTTETLGNFQILIASDFPLDFSDVHMNAVPSTIDLASPAVKPLKSHHPKISSRTGSSSSFGSEPNLASEAKSIAFGVSSQSSTPRSDPSSIDSQSISDGILRPNSAEYCDPFAPLMIPGQTNPIDIMKREPALPLPPSAPGSPMLRGHLIESYGPSQVSSMTGPVMKSDFGHPHPEVFNSIPSSAASNGMPKSPSKMDPHKMKPVRPGLSPKLIEKLGTSQIEPVPMKSLPRPPSFQIESSETRTEITASNLEESCDSHAMRFSMQSSFSNSIVPSLTSESDVRSLIPEDSLSHTIRFSWTKETAGGNARSPEWRKNPQWLLDVTKPAYVSFNLAQLGNRPPVSVGIYVLRASTTGPLRRIHIEDEEHRITPFDDDTSYVVTLNLPIGRYVIIPCTEVAGIEREALLSIKSSEAGEVNVQVLNDSWTCLQEIGEWTAETSGGCWTENSWIKNPQYRLHFKRRAQVTIVLSVSQQLSSPIGFYVISNRDPSFKMVLEVNPDNLMFPVQFRQRKEIVKSIQASDGETFNIVPATFLANQDFGQYSIMVYTSEPGLVTLEPISPFIEQVSFSGFWTPSTPGGCLDHASWRGNTQLKLTFPWSNNVRIGFTMVQSERPVESDDKTDPAVKAMLNEAVKASKASAREEAQKENSLISSSSASDPGDSAAPGKADAEPTKAVVAASIYGVEEDSGGETFEPFGFYVFPVEDHRVKRVLLDRNEFLIPAAFATARRVSGVLNTQTVESMILGSDNYGQLIVSPFHVNQYVEKPTNYELRIVVQYDIPIQDRLMGSPESNTKTAPVPSSLASIPYHRANFSHRGEWMDPLANTVIIPAEIKPPRDVEASKLARAEVRKFQIPEGNTTLVVLLIQKALCLGEIQVYKLGASHTAPNKVKNSKEEDLVLLLTKSTLVHRSILSRSKEIHLKCVIAEPGFYAIAAVPEVPESVGPVLLVTHYWKPIIDLNVDKTSAAEKQSKRTQVIGEILSTETSYVKNLKVLVHHFMTTLMTRAPELGVNVEDVKKIFSNIPTLLNCNTAFWEQLKATINSGENMIGFLFGEFCNYFRMYADYTNHFDANCRLLEELKKKSAFKEAMNALENHPNANRLHFRDYYITPVQRIPRYALLLEQLLKYTDEKHSDYQNLVQSLDRVKSVAFDINEKKRRADAESQVMSVQSMLFYKRTKDHPLIAVPARLFIRSGSASIIGIGPGDARAPPAPKSKKKVFLASDVPTLEQACDADHLFLFNDALILTSTKKANKKYFMMHQISLTSESDVSTYKDTVLCLRAFITASTSITYFLEFSNQQNRDLWMSELTVLIQVLVNQMHLKLASKMQAGSKVLDSKMQTLLPS